MGGLLLERPTPDFVAFERVLRGEAAPNRVRLVELGIDQEVLRAIFWMWASMPSTHSRT